MEVYTVEKDDYTISTNQLRLDIAFIHGFLKTAYWSKNIPEAVVRKSLKNSLCFGLYHKDKQVGFAKVITDYATVAYLADVFIIDTYRGRGLSKWLLERVLNHPDLQTLRRWMLNTADAHSLYEKFGFQALSKPELAMEKICLTAYPSQEKF